MRNRSFAILVATIVTLSSLPAAPVFAFTPPDAVVSDTEVGNSEEMILASLESLANSKSVSAEEGEKIKLLAATNLEGIGTAKSRPVLEALSQETPTVTVTEMGCRMPYERPLYPYPLEARKALVQILRRERFDAYKNSASQGDFSFLLEAEPTAGTEAAGESLALVDTVKSLSPEKRQEAIAILLDQSRLSRSKSLALAAAFLASGRAPKATEITHLDSEAALYLLQNREEYPENEQRALLVAAREHPAVASLAAILSGNEARLPLAEYLAVDGASAVGALANDKSETMSRQLAAVATDAVPPEVQRLAVAVLMIQDTDAARRELRTVVTSTNLPESYRAEVESWLNR